MPNHILVIDQGYPEPDALAHSRRQDRVFTPAMAAGERAGKYRGWQHAVSLAMAPEGEA